VKLIITEKPSVARDIARVLKVPNKHEGYIDGNGMLITWALGHLIEFLQPDAYGEQYQKWDMAQLPIIPKTFKTSPIERSKAQYNIVMDLLKRNDVTEVVCATDAGREGELIFRLVYEAAACKAPIERLWISSQTDAAIKEGFSKLKPGADYNPLYDSARSRAEADWLVGINATRAYSIKFSRGRGVMSVGRVQTPVLKLIVDRYRAHIQFDSKPFFEILLDVNHTNGPFQLKWFSKDTDRFQSKDKAEPIVGQLKTDGKVHVHALTQKKVQEKQPLLYDLTELQKDANKQFKFSADHTLKVMQDLYERYKLLSYPRTSSRYLTGDIGPKCPSLLAGLSKVPDFSDTVAHIQDQKYTIASRMIDDKKVTDHHAIIPTDKSPNVAELPEDHKKIYLMVIRRFIAAFLPECQKSHTEIMAHSLADTAVPVQTFKATGTVVLLPGWRVLYTEDEPKKNATPLLPNVDKGDALDIKKVQLKKGQTKAPALYTEASILGAMETAGKQIEDEDMRQAMKECGLGTPATRAQILEKLIHVKYIIRDKNKLIPTPKGEYLIDCILSEALLSPELTGQWEKELNNIAQSKGRRGEYMENIKEFTEEVVETVAKDNSYTIGADQTVYGSCPKCEKGKIIDTAKAYSCSEWKASNCSFAVWKEMAQKQITEAQVKKLIKDGETAIIKGFKSRDGNPFDAAIQLVNGEVKFKFDNQALGACPVCKKGEVTETSKAFSCNQWRETGCKFAIWKEIASRKMTKEEALILIEKKELDGLEGFKSRAGDPFTASLFVTEEGKVQFKPRA
jgi:DNA topoisomerase III